MAEFTIALGGNVGDTAAYMNRALELLTSGGAKISAFAAPIRSAPEGCAPGTPDFLNSAAAGEFDGTPEELLDLCQKIERELGRPADHGYNRPRTIDLDIITFGGLTLESERLTLPHPRAKQRRFVMDPLREILKEPPSELK
ncbi:MAG: 2-amino-4-hydroxy-6-hydroxymethyldihydropteridine diphosphokinase [Victivallaceae bacterium]|nr:2-amino-4-hydroxy-6-hydroxymethyldihydropteridine diphosphokinase [Victivallaceae bacterium]